MALVRLQPNGTNGTNGTNGKDKLKGTSKNDVIVALAGTTR